MEMTLKAADGTRLAARRTGRGAPVVFVHGSAGGRAHLVGASYGGTVALHTARGGVAGIRSVAVFEPPLFVAGAELAAVLDRFRALVAAGDVSAATRLFAEKVARVPAAVLDALAVAGDADRDAAQEAADAAEAVG